MVTVCRSNPEIIIIIIMRNAKRNTSTAMVNTGDVVKTSDVYRVDENLPARFNHPDCYRGYSTKRQHVRYQTTNQMYGSKKPTVHEMPTSFKGVSRQFSKSMLRSGMFFDSGFNTTLDKSRIMDTMATFNNRFYRHSNQHYSQDHHGNHNQDHQGS